ncbi:MAG: hypothetical protein AAGC79_08110 [Pseudomonadota bacterium]
MFHSDANQALEDLKMMILAQSLMIATRLDPVLMEPLPSSCDTYKRKRIRWPRLFNRPAKVDAATLECLTE